MHQNRLRASSFGSQAESYDAHRPRYPDAMIDDLLAGGARSILDVGAGTGIASRQFVERGATVLAVEPDARMAAVAQRAGVDVEVDTFEQWAPNGRVFDAVVFAASFHWVDPAVALPKIRGLLRGGGHLALLWNRLAPSGTTSEDLKGIYAGYWDVGTVDPHGHLTDLIRTLTAGGYDVEARSYPQTRHYTRQGWIDFAFTHSNYLTLNADQAATLRAELAERIGDGVTVVGDALAIHATPR
ncbi:class I SAM-dependent methyltransferase [Mycolicibacterium sp. 050158]|uniref:class I SAM-dependent methyltransferase n=1 Tax=Mycolicibacterium sp. 050158 TaxID=3090602 RepID=UPI00299D3E0C|nr:class I SAM-dependent methyltransferase [Mycolicibacterium sp. 050158]MDX1889595.1 class I SAM-dependent methyltransferase [Mycolicibacterium sp. 050158]